MKLPSYIAGKQNLSGVIRPAQTQASGKAISGLGQTLADIGAGLMEARHKEYVAQEKATAAATAKAQAALQKAESNRQYITGKNQFLEAATTFRLELQTREDYSEHLTDYTEFVNTQLGEILPDITDPVARNKFAEWAGDYIANGRIEVQGDALEKQAKSVEAALDNRVKQAIQGFDVQGLVEAISIGQESFVWDEGQAQDVLTDGLHLMLYNKVENLGRDVMVEAARTVDGDTSPGAMHRRGFQAAKEMLKDKTWEKQLRSLLPKSKQKLVEGLTSEEEKRIIQTWEDELKQYEDYKGMQKRETSDTGYRNYAQAVASGIRPTMAQLLSWFPEDAKAAEQLYKGKYDYLDHAVEAEAVAKLVDPRVDWFEYSDFLKEKLGYGLDIATFQSLWKDSKKEKASPALKAALDTVNGMFRSMMKEYEGDPQKLAELYAEQSLVYRSVMANYYGEAEPGKRYDDDEIMAFALNEMAKSGVIPRTIWQYVTGERAVPRPGAPVPMEITVPEIERGEGTARKSTSRAEKSGSAFAAQSWDRARAASEYKVMNGEYSWQDGGNYYMTRDGKTFHQWDGNKWVTIK